MSSTWIDWRVMFEEDMKIPGFKERFEKSYEEFKRQNEEDLAAERAWFARITQKPKRAQHTAVRLRKKVPA